MKNADIALSKLKLDTFPGAQFVFLWLYKKTAGDLPAAHAPYGNYNKKKYHILKLAL